MRLQRAASRSPAVSPSRTLGDKDKEKGTRGSSWSVLHTMATAMAGLSLPPPRPALSPIKTQRVVRLAAEVRRRACLLAGLTTM